MQELPAGFVIRKDSLKKAYHGEEKQIHRSWQEGGRGAGQGQPRSPHQGSQSFGRQQNRERRVKGHLQAGGSAEKAVGKNGEETEVRPELISREPTPDSQREVEKLGADAERASSGTPTLYRGCSHGTGRHGAGRQTAA